MLHEQNFVFSLSIKTHAQIRLSILDILSQLFKSFLILLQIEQKLIKLGHNFSNIGSELRLYSFPVSVNLRNFSPDTLENVHFFSLVVHDVF